MTPGTHEYRQFALTNFALKHRTSAIVLLVIIVILGVTSYQSVPKESSPDIEIPIISVSISYPGVAPKDMETLVARPVEEEINTIPDIKELTSTSVEGYTNIIAEFETSMDMQEALQKVREKVDLAKPDLPADANEPIISEFNLSEFPVVQVNISGEYGLERLKDVAEDVQDRLEQIPSILSVNLSGGLEREVQVDVDLAALKYYGVSFNDVIAAIQSENINVPGGLIDVGNVSYTLRVAGEFEDTRLMEDIIVKKKEGARPIYLRDVATVELAYRERESYARLDGQPVVTLDIVKRSGENIIETVEAAKAALADMEPGFPPTTVVKLTSDQSEDIHDMVSTLENNIISGLLLVVAVLLFFLGLRTSSFVALSIPLSMLLSFAVMKVMGISMNMVVLFSLILALGMLVDNAIVVVENIYRYREEGYDNWTSARRATGEIAMPVIASTFTTLGAFAPLLFWPGIVGEFMGFLPLTLIITLSSSLFVAIVIIPVLCAMFMKLEDEPKAKLTPAARWTAAGIAAVSLLAIAASNPISAVLVVLLLGGVVVGHKFVMSHVGRWFQFTALPAMVRWYERQLRWALAHRGVIIGGTLGLFIVMVTVFGRFNAGVEYFPESVPPAMVQAQIDAPSGTRTEFVNDVASRVEDQLRGIDGFQDVESVVATVGSSGEGVSAMFAGGGDANVSVHFVDFEDRQSDVFAMIRRMQEGLGSGIAGADLQVVRQEMGPPSGAPVTVELVGEDPDQLKALADRAVAILEAAPVGARLDGLESDMSDGRQELVIDVDREKAALWGLSTASVGNTIRSAIQGAEAAKYRTGNDEYDIIVRLAESYRDDLDALNDLTVVNGDGIQVPLPSVATWRVEEGFGSVRRKDMDRVATITSDVVAGENSNAVLAEVQRTLTSFRQELPPGYEMRYAGEQEDQQEAIDFLSSAFMLAIMLIAFILISQFNSVVKPVIILTSVFMSTIGVLGGLLIFRMPFGIIMTGVGIISLAGVVVNNAIVLIDYIDILRERDGMDRREALIQGGMTRFRPVVLTAVTTVLGLVPLAIGLNFDFLGLFRSLNPNVYWGGEQAAWWGPMAIAVIAGLTFATFLTLILVPVMYSLVDDITNFFKRHYTWSGRQEAKRMTREAGERDETAPVVEPERQPAAVARLREAKA